MKWKLKTWNIKNTGRHSESENSCQALFHNDNESFKKLLDLDPDPHCSLNSINCSQLQIQPFQKISWEFIHHLLNHFAKKKLASPISQWWFITKFPGSRFKSGLLPKSNQLFPVLTTKFTKNFRKIRQQSFGVILPKIYQALSQNNNKLFKHSWIWFQI